ncbi:hypothetical protein NIES2135_20430 [Leptolyngbya boryana NIES-2135]|jgi:hypothetical protein|uniref:Uncharacterized protein n=1 Tax=Leptolyngbya boryana NIES-2135 TaxID=1973484 RepID=A0A1Z4JET1_LEPBY|nr:MULTISPECIES: hypothetical protein [Leptolyngbya]BAY55220.1 hypothetical protein NIES2135_20430 [Leptolyngbya boryana NIES-2135]MBD2369307.1 hypothetical protein [Leptolyngbya sp. FACHB-161]MBD2375691.1 hypothetical protein [Leptolyngbya sp. FACHB-238]MBD2401040.1 hypothetical protein [Leptolyngbya sp. FACHB-239]MBD2406625.1 hypothetical protein [Leptolyngbya sp. FACHB-402]
MNLELTEEWKLGSETPAQGSFIVAFSPGRLLPVLLRVDKDFHSGFAQMLHQGKNVELIDYSLPITVWAYAPKFRVSGEAQS